MSRGNGAARLRGRCRRATRDDGGGTQPDAYFARVTAVRPRPAAALAPPRLTGLAFDRRARTPREHQGDLPVVLVTGHRGMGRSAILAELAARYAGRLPLAHVRAVPPRSVAALRTGPPPPRPSWSS
ncbi:hypothetical protein NKH77_42050 [Streptomyces sp. M19]